MCVNNQEPFTNIGNIMVTSIQWRGRMCGRVYNFDVLIDICRKALPTHGEQETLVPISPCGNRILISST